MTLDLPFLGLAIAAPAAIAAVLFVALRKLLPGDLAQRYAATIAFGAASLSGYALTGAAAYPPERHWQWLPVLALGSSLLGGIAAAKGLRHVERIVLWLATTLVTAWLIVPTWEDLTPSRDIWIIALALGFALLAGLLEPLATRAPTPSRLLGFTITAMGVAVLTAAFLSLTYAKLALVPAAAFGGCFLGSLAARTTAVQGLALPYAVVVGGWAFVGTIDPPNPLWPLLAAPLAPLALWCFAAGPLARLRGATGFFARLGAIIAILAIAAGGLVATVGLP